MNIFLMSNANVGPVNGRLAKAELQLAANKLGWKTVYSVSQAELVVVVGSQIPADTSLLGKKIFVCDINHVFNYPEQLLKEASEQATVYSEVVATPASTTAKRIVAITACPTGVAHTFMAAEAIEEEAKKRGWWSKVETRGSVGVGNELTAEDIASADIVFVAADIDVDLSKFAGKLMYRTKTGPALKKTVQEFDNAFKQATVYQPQQNSGSVATGSQEKKGVYKHLLTGVSYMLPMVVAGGLIIALAFAFGEFVIDPVTQIPVLVGQPELASIGGMAFGLMVPLLAGYISFSIADRPGLVPGLVGGMIASSIGAGFLGGIVVGYFAGYLVMFLAKYIRLPQSMEALKPILILPLFSTVITGLAMIFLIGPPIADLMKALEYWLNNMQTTNAVILGAVLGGMMCTDMGGPINKVAYAFGVGLLSSQQYAPMAAVMAGGMVPPLAMSLATFIAKKKFANSERESGKAAFVLGLCFISEGAIPFAARDPLRVIPSCIIGGAITGGLALAFGAKLMTPHGGLFALAIPGVVTPVLGYLVSIIVGSVVAGLIYAVIKRPEQQVNEVIAS